MHSTKIKTVTKDEVFNDFNYYLDMADQKFMSAKAWYQYERTKQLHGIAAAYNEYVACHEKSMWEERFKRA